MKSLYTSYSTRVHFHQNSGRPYKRTSSDRFIVLDKPVVPQYVIVHDGVPDVLQHLIIMSASRLYKNVASSEIFLHIIHQQSINVLAILSFTLNHLQNGTGEKERISQLLLLQPDHAFFYGKTFYVQYQQL